MLSDLNDSKKDMAGYNEYYQKEEPVDNLDIHSKEDYIDYYTRTAITPFCRGGVPIKDIQKDWPYRN